MKYVLLALALLSGGCRGTPPLAPAPPPAAESLYRLTLAVAIGQGAEAGHATITATVQTLQGIAVPDLDVAFTTDAGTLSVAHQMTDANGVATSALVSTSHATVTVTAGDATRTALVAAQPAPIAPTPDPPYVPPPVVTPPPPPAPQAGYAVTVSAAPSTLVAGNSSTLTALVSLLNGASAPTAYDWDCNADNTVDSSTAVNFSTCAYPLAGPITSRVTVRNGTVTVSASTLVTVTPAAPLTVALTAGTLTPTINVADLFTATVTSLGPLPAVLNWEWDQDGDGVYDTSVATVATPQTQALAFGVVGVKTIKVRVTDPLTGRTAIGTVQITVVP